MMGLLGVLVGLGMLIGLAFKGWRALPRLRKHFEWRTRSS
jgi:hypothetical protein